MVFLGLRYPGPASRRVATDHGTKGGFNYPKEHVGLSRHCPPAPEVRKESKGRSTDAEDGSFKLSMPYATDCTFAKVGGGQDDFQTAKHLVSKWKHFQLGWSTVDESTGTTKGSPVCVCANILGIWIRNPLEIVYIEESVDARNFSGNEAVKKRYSFAHGCLDGHLLAGEEAFIVELRNDDSVWFGVNTFSKPAHPLAVVSYPVVRLLQWRFAHDATKTMKREVRKAKER
tara:strand:- start:1758 stop:2447 length:690 start_codon:yes stop_codon:yes gene_type:complete